MRQYAWPLALVEQELGAYKNHVLNYFSKYLFGINLKVF